MNEYKCLHCGKIMKYDTDKKWIKSFCEKANKTVHLMIIEV